VMLGAAPHCTLAGTVNVVIFADPGAAVVEVGEVGLGVALPGDPLEHAARMPMSAVVRRIPVRRFFTFRFPSSVGGPGTR
jgi:hypothetical protein